MSSGVNSLAAVTLEDFIKTFIAPNLSEKKATLYTKLLGITVDPVYSERGYSEYSLIVNGFLRTDP